MFLGELSGLLTAGLWSTTSFMFTEVSIRIGSVQLNITRMIIAAILLLITFLIFRISFDFNYYQFLYLSLSGVIGLSFGDSFLYKAYKMIGPRISILIMSLSPAIASFFAFFMLGELLSMYAVIGMIITIAGVFLVVLERNKNSNSKFKISVLGVFFALIATLGQGIGLVVAKISFTYGDINPLIATFIRLSSAILIILPVAILFKKYKNPIKILKNDRKSLKMILIASFIGPYLGITFSILAIMYAKIGIASTLMSTSPIIMLPISKIVYKEKLSWKSILGAFIAVFGIAILFLS